MVTYVLVSGTLYVLVGGVDADKLSIFRSRQSLNRKTYSFLKYVLFYGIFKLLANHAQGKVINYLGFTMTLDNDKKTEKRIAKISYEN